MSEDQNTVMGVDLGTQSIKVIIYHPINRQILASSSEPIELVSKADGSMEQQASWWIDGFKKCVAAIDPELKKYLVAIGVSGQQHGFVPINKNGSVLAPVKLWCDTSTTLECEEIMDAVGGEEECINISGNPIAVGYTASKIRWLKKNNPDAYARMTSILLPHDYLNYYLTGNRYMECGDASGTGLLNVKTRQWSKRLIHALDDERDLTSCLPTLIEADDICGTIKREIADELDLPKDIIISAGGGDNMMAAIGTGNVECGKLTASLGTSGTLFAYHNKPAIDPKGELAAFCSSTGGWLPLLCTMNCTVATEQMRDLLEVDLGEMEKLASFIPPGADGVITIPFFNGERTPALPNAKASIFGLDGKNTTNAHLIRSTMEAAIFNLKAGIEAFERCGMTFTEVTLTGGGSKSTLWRQICADILNLPVRVLIAEENAAFGAALQAYWAHKKQNGIPKELKLICKDHLFEDESKGCSPNAEAVKTYEKIYQDYQAFVKLISQHYA
ncbi:MAG: xylulokinase [Emcibacteraceae bacterium]|nr:xylulokinase [Emcibacteraceae bacterium]MDG1858133.1 xylulokinase [Emcibacteraceae bacterium]